MVSEKRPELCGRRYPWDEWLRRPFLILRRGTYFDCEPSSMAVMLRMQVGIRNLLRTIRISGDTVTVGPKSDWRGRKRCPR